MSNDVLTIRPPKPQLGGVQVADGTRFVLQDGREVPNVTKCVVTYELDCFVTATLDLAISPDEDITAMPLLSLDTVREAAKRYGFDLVKA